MLLATKHCCLLEPQGTSGHQLQNTTTAIQHHSYSHSETATHGHAAPTLQQSVPQPRPPESQSPPVVLLDQVLCGRAAAALPRTSTVSPSTATTRLMKTLSPKRSLVPTPSTGWKITTSPGTGGLVSTSDQAQVAGQGRSGWHSGEGGCVCIEGGCVCTMPPRRRGGCEEDEDTLV